MDHDGQGLGAFFSHFWSLAYILAGGGSKM